MNRGTPEALFAPAQSAALACVLDEIVPRSGDGRLPGAGELGLVAQLEGAAQKSPELLAALRDGLARLDEQLAERGGSRFEELPREARREVLNALAATAPAFVPALVFQTYVAYYRHPRVLEALGLEARPPFPKGYEMEPGDFGLLDPVRERRRMYREV